MGDQHLKTLQYRSSHDDQLQSLAGWLTLPPLVPTSLLGSVAQPVPGTGCHTISFCGVCKTSSPPALPALASLPPGGPPLPVGLAAPLLMGFSAGGHTIGCPAVKLAMTSPYWRMSAARSQADGDREAAGHGQCQRWVKQRSLNASCTSGMQAQEGPKAAPHRPSAAAAAVTGSTADASPV